MNYEKMWDSLKTALLVRDDNNTLSLMRKVEDNFSPPRGSDIYEGLKSRLRDIRSQGKKVSFVSTSGIPINQVTLIDIDSDNFTYKLSENGFTRQMFYSGVNAVQEV